VYNTIIKAAIFLNLALFCLGLYLEDYSVVAVSAGSAMLCLIGIKIKNE